MHNFRKLIGWSAACELGADVYAPCGSVTRPESRVITSQLRRAALSIAANIAEGCGKNSRAETIRYLEIAGGSAAETEHHLIVAMRTRILDAEVATPLLARATAVRRMLRLLVIRLPR
ncbi:MAG: four helix bundle protein [Gemmatimonadota bacterium]|nr:four helix bundle protein [Gemmatimonadota bacterium]